MAGEPEPFLFFVKTWMRKRSARVHFLRIASSLVGFFATRIEGSRIDWKRNAGRTVGVASLNRRRAFNSRAPRDVPFGFV